MPIRPSKASAQQHKQRPGKAQRRELTIWALLSLAHFETEYRVALDDRPSYLQYFDKQRRKPKADLLSAVFGGEAADDHENALQYLIARVSARQGGPRISLAVFDELMRERSCGEDTLEDGINDGVDGGVLIDFGPHFGEETQAGEEPVVEEAQQPPTEPPAGEEPHVAELQQITPQLTSCGDLGSREEPITITEDTVGDNEARAALKENRCATPEIQQSEEPPSKRQKLD